MDQTASLLPAIRGTDSSCGFCRRRLKRAARCCRRDAGVWAQRLLSWSSCPSTPTCHLTCRPRSSARLLLEPGRWVRLLGTPMLPTQKAQKVTECKVSFQETEEQLLFPEEFLWTEAALQCSCAVTSTSCLVSPLPGGGGHQHRRNVSDHRRHHLRYWPRLLQTEELQRAHGHGVAHRHTLLQGTGSSALLNV